MRFIVCTMGGIGDRYALIWSTRKARGKGGRGEILRRRSMMAAGNALLGFTINLDFGDLADEMKKVRHHKGRMGST